MGALAEQLPAPASECQQLPENAEDADDDDFGEVPDDTLAAVLLLRSQFPKLKQKDVPRVALRSQIYSVVKDRTIVDRQLDDLRCCVTLWVQVLHECLGAAVCDDGVHVQAAEQAENV